MQVLNANAEVQDLDAAVSTRYMTIDMSVRLQDLDVAPDPRPTTSCWNSRLWTTSTGHHHRLDRDRQHQRPHRWDISWPIDLGQGAAGDEILRVRMVGYEGGDTLCPGAGATDDDCAVPFNLSIDTYEPNLLSMSVFLGGADLRERRRVYDDTWVIPSATQQMRLIAQDLPSPRRP